MKNRPETKLVSVILALMMILMLTGCAATPSQNVENTQVPTPTQPAVPNPTPDNSDIEKAVGTVLLSVNPEIKINYDGNGNVISLEGNNEDGRRLLQDYSDYKGKPCKTVVNELVEKMNTLGFFSDKIEGNAKNIIVKLEDDREDIYEDILEEIAEEIREAVRRNNIGSETVVVGRADITDKGFIGLEKAKEIVLSQLGFTEADFTEKEYGLDYGVYELEFTVNGIEYEYDVDAITGKVLKAEAEKDDDTKPDNKPQHGKELIGKDKAKEIALLDKGLSAEAVSYYECELDDGVYEIEFVVDGIEYSYDINAFTGKILRMETEKVDHHNKPVTGGKELIGKDKAKATALDHAGVTEADITRYKCELDEGKYDVEFTVNGVEYDYEIDAYTGAVVKAETERADDKPVVDPTILITEAEAKATALAHAGVAEADITLYKCKLDDDYNYDIEFTVNGIEYDYEISAYTGAVVKAETEKADDKPVTGKTLIGEAKAKEIALEHKGISANTVREYECELDEGRYEIDFKSGGMEYEYEIDAYTGKILKAEAERDD